MDGLSAAASVIAIGQALAAAPKVIRVLRCLVEARQEIIQLINEVELLNAIGKLIRDTEDHLRSIPNFQAPPPDLLKSVEADWASVVSQLEKLAKDCGQGKKKNGQIRISRIKWLWHKDKIASLTETTRRNRDCLQLILNCNSIYATTYNGRMLLDIHTIVTTQSQTGSHALLPFRSPGFRIREIDSHDTESDDTHTVKKAASAGTSLVSTNEQSRSSSIVEDDLSQIPARERILQHYEPLIQMTATLRRACPKGCLCQCHSPTSRTRPQPVLSPIYGWLSYAYNGVPRVGRPRCDILTCQRAHSPIRFDLRLPLLFCSRALEVSLLGAVVGVGASLHLRVARYLSHHDGIWSEIQYGKIGRVHLALACRQISPIDGRAQQLTLDSSSNMVIAFDDENTEDRWPVHSAIYSRSGLEEVLNKSPEGIDALDGFGNAPLHCAVEIGDSAAIQILIAHGANMNVRNVHGNTPLSIAVSKADVDCVNAFIRGGCDLNNNSSEPEGYTALYSATQSSIKGTAEMVRLLMDHGAQPTYDEYGLNILHGLAQSPAASEVEEKFRRLAAVVDLEEKNDRGFTPLLEALIYNNKAMIRLILDAGCKFDSTWSEYNALIIAAYSADAGSLDILGEAGLKMDVRLRDKDEFTPLDILEWRMGRDASELPYWTMPPADDDVRAFGSLIKDVRDRYLAAEIRTLETVVQHLEARENSLARRALQPVVQEKINWNVPAEHRTFRTIDLQVKEGMIEAVIEALEEFIDVSRARIGTDPFEDDYCRSISLGDEGLVVESNS
ncbi:ankyrin [Hypoxylon sp. FL1150]|nr:ankyrin [Hypoxylon sp. FL1150]